MSETSTTIESVSAYSKKAEELLEEYQLPRYALPLLRNLSKREIEIKPVFIRVLKKVYNQLNKNELTEEEKKSFLFEMHTRLFILLFRSQYETEETGKEDEKNNEKDSKKLPFQFKKRVANPSTVPVTALYNVKTKPNSFSLLKELTEQTWSSVQEISSLEPTKFRSLRGIFSQKGLPSFEQIIDFLDFFVATNSKGKEYFDYSFFRSVAGMLYKSGYQGLKKLSQNNFEILQDLKEACDKNKVEVRSVTGMLYKSGYQGLKDLFQNNFGILKDLKKACDKNKLEVRSVTGMLYKSGYQGLKDLSQNNFEILQDLKEACDDNGLEVRSVIGMLTGAGYQGLKEILENKAKILKDIAKIKDEVQSAIEEELGLTIPFRKFSQIAIYLYNIIQLIEINRKEDVNVILGRVIDRYNNFLIDCSLYKELNPKDNKKIPLENSQFILFVAEALQLTISELYILMKLHGKNIRGIKKLFEKGFDYSSDWGRSLDDGVSDNRRYDEIVGDKSSEKTIKNNNLIISVQQLLTKPSIALKYEKMFIELFKDRLSGEEVRQLVKELEEDGLLKLIV